MVTSANGVAKATTKPDELKNGILKVVPQPAVKIEIPKKEEEKLPPLDDRLLRLGQLFDLQTKYNRLQTSYQKLNDFELKKGSENISFSISDRTSREDFSTSNPEVIKEVLAFVKQTILKKRKEIEPLLKW